PEETLEVRKELRTVRRDLSVERRTLIGCEVERGVDERLEPQPLLTGHSLGWRTFSHEPSASRSSTRALTQSRSTVRVVTPNASAISSLVIPPKNRHSTTRARRASIRSR